MSDARFHGSAVPSPFSQKVFPGRGASGVAPGAGAAVGATTTAVSSRRFSSPSIAALTILARFFPVDAGPPTLPCMLLLASSQNPLIQDVRSFPRNGDVFP